MSASLILIIFYSAFVIKGFGIIVIPIFFHSLYTMCTFFLRQLGASKLLVRGWVSSILSMASIGIHKGNKGSTNYIMLVLVKFSINSFLNRVVYDTIVNSLLFDQKALYLVHQHFLVDRSHDILFNFFFCFICKHAEWIFFVILIIKSNSTLIIISYFGSSSSLNSFFFFFFCTR